MYFLLRYAGKSVTVLLNAVLLSVFPSVYVTSM